MKIKALILLLVLSLGILAFPIPKVQAQGYEDFSIYTEINDGDNHINLAGNYHIDSLLERNDDNASLFRDFGSGFFTNFTHTIDIKANSGSPAQNSDLAMTWALSNDLDDWKGLLDNSKTALCVGIYDSYDTPYTLSIREVYGGVQYQNTWTSAVSNTWYYLTIIKNGTSLTMEAFSNSNRTTSVHNFTLTLQADHSFRYVFGCMSYNTGHAVHSNHDIENLDLNLPTYTITFRFTDYGTFRRDGVTLANGTQTQYLPNEVLELSALPFNATCLFLNFTFGTSFHETNPYNYTTPSENQTVWCLFEDPPYGKLAPPVVGVSVQVLFIGAACFFGSIGFLFFILRRKKK